MPRSIFKVNTSLNYLVTQPNLDFPTNYNENLCPIKCYQDNLKCKRAPLTGSKFKSGKGDKTSLQVLCVKLDCWCCSSLCPKTRFQNLSEYPNHLPWLVKISRSLDWWCFVWDVNHLTDSMGKFADLQGLGLEENTLIICRHHQASKER